jgi:hypothetical protein
MRLALNDHFVRYCKPSQLSEDGRVLNLAFRLRSERDERSLSGDHFEYFSENSYTNIINALDRRHFTPSRNGKLAKLNCGTVINRIQSFCLEEVYFERDSCKPAVCYGSHTGLFGLYEAHTSVTEFLCNCILEQVSVSDYISASE